MLEMGNVVLSSVYVTDVSREGVNKQALRRLRLGMER